MTASRPQGSSGRDAIFVTGEGTGQQPMKVTVKLFAVHRQLLGRREAQVEAPEGATIGDVWRALKAQYPQLSHLSDSVLAALNQDYAPLDTRVQPGDEIAFIPPVSGGTEPAPLFAVVDGPIDEGAVRDAVADPGAGGICLFSGVVRDNSRGKRVLYLEYEAYPEMAARQMRVIESEMRARWSLQRVAMVHRTGRLEIGEASVCIAVSTAHRAEAFEACRYAIDRLKQILPVWKKEVWEGGEYWVGWEGNPDASEPIPASRHP